MPEKKARECVHLQVARQVGQEPYLRRAGSAPVLVSLRLRPCSQPLYSQSWRVLLIYLKHCFAVHFFSYEFQNQFLKWYF